MRKSFESFVVVAGKWSVDVNLAFVVFFFSLIFLVGGVVLGGFGWYSHRTAARLTRPLNRIGKLRPGPRKVRGRIAASEEVLNSPVTNQKCVYYRLRVYEERKKWRPTNVLRGSFLSARAFNGILFVYSFEDSFASQADQANERAAYSWNNLLDEAVSVPFRIEDETGFVEVDARDASVNAKTKARTSTSMSQPLLALSPLTDRLREEHGIEFLDERGQFKTLHFVEEVLLIGANVTVLGSVESNERGELCFRADDDALLVTEGDVVKVGRAARSRAIGLAVGAGIAFIVGVACLFGAFALNLRTWPTR
jgi:hypothetical protein